MQPSSVGATRGPGTGSGLGILGVPAPSTSELQAVHYLGIVTDLSWGTGHVGLGREQTQSPINTRWSAPPRHLCVKNSNQVRRT